MRTEDIVYAGYVAIFAVLVALILVTPVLAFSGNADALYNGFAYSCHQKLSRSLCVFNDAGSYRIADCAPSGIAYVPYSSDRIVTKVAVDGVTGYKMPVCARDFGIYGAMLLAALLYPVMRDIGNRKVFPAIWLVLALAPLAIDGGLQLLSEIDQPAFGHNILPFEYESSNAMRLLTGGIAGFAASFYAIPLLINLFAPYPQAPQPQAKAAATAGQAAVRARDEEGRKNKAAADEGRERKGDAPAPEAGGET